jgi:hypothetical protein
LIKGPTSALGAPRWAREAALSIEQGAGAAKFR